MRTAVLLATLAFVSDFPVQAAPATTPRPAYESETWPEARQLVWARPGENGKFEAPGNWLEGGKPASRAPDRETDVLLPAAAERYEVSSAPGVEARHVTIEANARLLGVHRNDVQIWGNLWVKDGGWAYFVAIRGPKHTFLRIDNADFPNANNQQTYLGGRNGAPPPGPPSRTKVSHKFEIAKYGGASVEVIGNVGVGDEIMVQHGKLIVSGDLRWSGVSGKGALEVYDGGILELQSGGAVAPFDSFNHKHVYNINLYRNAVLQGGSPERPLTADAFVRLGIGPNEKPGSTGLYAAEGSVLRVYSADPKKARLVFTSITAQPDAHDAKARPIAAPGKTPTGTDGIVLRLAGNVELNGVVFDYMSKGGIRLEDTAARERWQNVAFGPHNAGPPDTLFARLDVDGNIYYHNRGDGRSEFALTTKAVKSMEDFMKARDPYRIAVSPAPIKVGQDGAAFEKPLTVVFEHPIDVVISAQLPEADLRYTLDGSEPTPTSPRYTGAIRIAESTRLQVKAFAPGRSPSATFAASYVFKK